MAEEINIISASNTWKNYQGGHKISILNGIIIIR